MSRFSVSNVVVALFFATVSQSAAAQGVPGQAGPLEFPALDARGVDTPTGAAVFNSPSIAIGDPETGGLIYLQEFVGGGYNRGGDWRHNVIGGISVGAGGATVSLMSGIERFTVSGGVYTPQYGTGSSLAYNSATGVYTYTLADGTVATFDTALTNAEVTYGARDGLITSLTQSNGLRWDYHYGSAMSVTYSGSPLEPIVTFEGPYLSAEVGHHEHRLPAPSRIRDPVDRHLGRV